MRRSSEHGLEKFGSISRFAFKRKASELAQAVTYIELRVRILSSSLARSVCAIPRSV
jgi:hypothetical protein